MKKKSRNCRIFGAAGVLLLGLTAGSTPGLSAQEAVAEPITQETAIQTLAPESSSQEIAPEANSREQLVMTLFSRETTPEEYEAAFFKANTAGVSAQVLLESQIIRSLYSQDKDKLVALKTPLQNFGMNLDVKNSQLFTSRSDFDSMLEGLRALQSEQNDDATGFETHIKEAIWQSPALYQPLFLGWLNEYRKNEAMKKVVVPLNTKLMTSDSTETNLQNLMGNNKAMLLDFWASWCAPCMASMGELKIRGEKLAPQGVIVVGMNTEGSADKAALVKQRENIALPWLVEPEGEPYSLLLEADSIPRNVLISREGKVLFNGHPNDPALIRALAKIGATL